MIVYTLEDLKKVYDKESHGRIGMWAFHAKLHDGHRQCAKIARQKSDYNICIHWQNFGEGMKLLVGDSVDPDNPIDNKVIEEALTYSDVVMIFKDNYHPYMEYYDYIKKVLDKDFPEELLIKKGIRNSVNLYGSLVYSVAVRILIHEIYQIKVHYHPTCGRERWKMAGYPEWCLRKFGLVYDLLEPAKDEYGNVISGMKNRLPEHIKKRINKQLILPHFKTREELEKNISDIEGLKIAYFFREQGWIQVQFYFEESPTKFWWVEGIKSEEKE